MWSSFDHLKTFHARFSQKWRDFSADSTPSLILGQDIVFIIHTAVASEESCYSNVLHCAITPELSWRCWHPGRCMHVCSSPAFRKMFYHCFLFQLPQALDFCMLQRFSYFNNWAEIFHLNADNLKAGTLPASSFQFNLKW